MSDDGLAAIDAACDLLAGGATLIETVTRLRRAVGGERTSPTIDAARARRRSGLEASGGGRCVFTLAGLEQRSDPVVAATRAARFEPGRPVVDLCAGEGGDAMAIARRAAAVMAIDIDAARLVLCRHNTRTLPVPVRCVQADARRPPVRAGRLVHVDPSRRGPGGRARRLAEYRPPVTDLVPVLRRAEGAALVLSPAVDLTDPDLPTGVEIEFIQVGRRLVEAVAWFGALRHEERRATATIVDDSPLGADPNGTNVIASTGRHGPPAEVPVKGVGEWLLEPSPAATRARVHTDLGATVGAWRIAEHRALLSTTADPGPSPWWRRWRVEAVLPPRVRHVRDWLATADTLPVSVAVHGLDVDVEAFIADLGRPERGPQGRRIHLVRLDEGARAYVCRQGDRDERAGGP